MLLTLFTICAVAGGAILALLLLLTLLGFSDFGDIAPDFEVADDVDFDLDAGGDGHSDLLGFISLRTVVAAVTFFGLGGLLARSMNLEPPMQLVIALVCGGGAMYAVYALVRLLYSFAHEGTIKIKRAIGAEGTVYIPIPGENSGTGKVQLKTQGRIMEFHAMTAAPEKLKTGAKVKVVGVVSSSTLEVEPLHAAKSTKPAEPERRA